MAHKLVSHVIMKQRFFVYKINEISFRKRLFCILDPELPFVLNLKYKELNNSLEFSPIIGGNGTFQLREKTNVEKVYNFRFKTMEECQHNIDEIQKKKFLIDEMLIGFTENILLEHNRKMLKKIKPEPTQKKYNI
jgi:hypothetical protein